MTEYFIVANSFAAPFVSDQSTSFVEADSPTEALEKFAADYGHPAGLYAANCYASANDYHKNADPLAQWLSNHVLAEREAIADKKGYSYLGHGPGDFEINGERITIDDPKGGRVISP